MAWYIDSTKVQQSTKTELAHWKTLNKPGEKVEHSGIYYCIVCSKEVACNAGDPFPPQNHHQHQASFPAIGWKLLVRTDSHK